MVKDATNVIEILREKNYRFRTLEKTHHQLETSLEGMNRRRILTPEEEVQRKTYQKEKLAAKDTMENIIRHFISTGEVDFK